VNTSFYEIVEDRTEPARDGEIEELLRRAYVGAGFTASEHAATLFDAGAVRGRGTVLSARERADRALVGMIIAVPPTSPARRMAADDEMELHLLAVAPDRERSGIGAALVEAALSVARREGYARVVLWTQPRMDAAQRLYERAGFVRAPGRDWRREDRSFLVYELLL
jgi:ribosomal protein S18 acetylase RimI-like enzyme